MQDMRILKSKKLQEYILKTFCYPKEHEQLKQLREATVDKYQHWSIMNVPVDEAIFLSMLLKVTNAKKIIEIGVFTGYSLLNAALAVPNDALILAIDPDREAYETGLPYIRKAGVESKIKFIQSDAQTILKDLLAKNEEAGSFDFVFVDADKENYVVYHELVLKLVKIGGLICYDNTLWKGSVALSEDDEMEDFLKGGSKTFRAFNEFIAGDARVEVSLVSIGDGLTICRRLE
uniref:Caffeoyl-CoA O-methyltransferase n=1 Tax=Kalanchoe fedtschenkoi TaxID=63787 RepID=A0A7N0ZYS0_KALFE